MTTFTKRRARVVRSVTAREPRNPRRLLLYIGIAIGFAAIGFAATLAPGQSGFTARQTFAPLGGRPSAVAATTNALYVADDQTGSVRVVDAHTLHEVGRPIAVGASPVAVVVADGSLFVGQSSGDITRVSLTTRRVSGRIHAGGSITGLAFDGRHVWAADLQRRELESIDPHRMRVVRRVHAVAAVRVAATRKAVWATTANDQVLRYEPATRRIQRTSVGPGPIGLVVDRSAVWVAVGDGARVVRLNASSMRVTDRIRVGHGPVNLAEARGVVWVTNNDDQTLSTIDARSRRVVGAPLDVQPDLRGAAVSSDVWFVGTDPSGLVKAGG